MNSRPVIFFTVSNGWGIRNYLHTGAFSELAAKHRVVIYALDDLRPGLAARCEEIGIEVRTLHHFEESGIARGIRQFKKKLFQSTHRIETERIKEGEARRGRVARLLGRMISVFARSPLAGCAIWGANALERRYGRDRRYRDAVVADRPALVVIGSPFYYVDTALLFEAQAIAATPSVALIPSWDNLTSKGMISTRYASILVWSEHQRQEVLRLYPMYDPRSVIVTGIPQFDIYAAELPQHLQMPEFGRALGIPAGSIVLLYTTCGPKLFPDEPEVVRQLADALRDGSLPASAHLLVRCHPNDDAARYAIVSGDARVTIWAPSRQPGQTLNTWTPPPDELSVLAAMLRASKVCINVASTTTLDALAAGVPVVNVAYDGDRERVYIESTRRYYDYTHYKPVVEIGGVPIARNRAELIAAIHAFLQDPALLAPQRALVLCRFCNVRIGASVAETTRAIAEAVRT